MLTEAGVTYNFTFTKQQRREAAGLAYDLAREKGKGHKTALLKSAKAFLTRSLTIASDEVSAQRFSGLRSRVLRMVEKKVISRVVTQGGYDPVRRRGQAINYGRRAIIRTWPFKGPGHPGHASLSSQELATSKKKKKHMYLSWWPDYDYKSIFKKVLSKFRLDPFLSQFAKSKSLYYEDKISELSDRTIARLMVGADSEKSLKNYPSLSKFDKDYLTANPLQPRARQAPIRGTSLWGRQSDKVYVPFMGTNKLMDSDQERFVLFGLEEQKMDAFIDSMLQDSETGKQQYSFYGSNNCSGVVIKALKAAGADCFVKLGAKALFLPTPNSTHRLAIDLQERVEALNSKADQLYERYESAMSDPKSSARVLPEGFSPELSVFVRQWQSSPQTGLTVKMQKAVKKAQDAAGQFGNEEQTVGKLMPKAVALVEAIDEAYAQAEDSETIESLAPCLHAFHQARELMKAACA